MSGYNEGSRSQAGSLRCMGPVVQIVCAIELSMAYLLIATSG
jgi:hypothetical protein